jgi:hypothetical protein
MHVYRFSLWKLLLALLLCIGFSVDGYFMIVEYERRIEHLGYVLVVVFPLLAPICLRFLLSDRVVLRIDPHGIEYKTLFGQQRVLWRDFRGTAVQSVTTRGALGGSETARHLKLNFGKGFFGNCSISEKLLEGGVAVEDILTTLQECLQGAAALSRGDYRHASLGPRGAPAQAPAPAAPVVAGFGRKGL